MLELDSPLDGAIRNELVRAAERASWSVGEFVHRRVGDQFIAARDGTERFDVAGSSAVRGRPTQPPNDQSVRPKPIARVANPVLTAADVTDYARADFVADPFLLASEAEGWNLFFEVFNRNRRPTAVIGHATSDDRGRSWEYNGVVLREDVHLAFPYVFEREDTFYMVPERWNRDRPAAVRLYRTETLPDGWQPMMTIVDPDRPLVDCVVFRWNDRWWAFLGSGDGRHDLLAYHADDLLTEQWTPHARNPIVSARPRAARPAGRPILSDDGIVLFLQDCARRYGDKVRAFDIERLSPTTYEDSERADSPVLEASDRLFGWNSGQMHHIDVRSTPAGRRCVVDGNIGLGRRLFDYYHWAIGTYRL